MVATWSSTAGGEVQAYQFFPAVICSHARFTYTEVAAILANTRGPEAQRRLDLVPHLLHLHEVYRALLKERTRARRDRLRDHRDADRLRRERPDREDRAAHPHRRAQADRGGDARRQRLLGRLHRACRSTRRCIRVHEGPTPEKRMLLQNYLKALGLGPVDRRRTDAGRVPGRSPRRPRTGPTRRRSTPCCCARCSRRSTPASTAATSASPTRPTRTSRARSAAIPTCSCTASSRRC